MVVVKNNNDNMDYLFNKATGIVLKKYREKANMSLEEVNQKMSINISRQALFKYENNLARIKNNTFIDICRVLQIDPDETFKEINNIFLYLLDKEK